ncbi:MAG TPA: hypothetical protein VHB98_20125 [Chloroflexota bacterium]|nr:hypothetical protein [Chloroflexota bacterium]
MNSSSRWSAAPWSVPPATGGFSPLDEELGLLPQVTLTPTLVESVVRLGSWIPFTQTPTLLAHFVHTQVSEATVTRLTERAGAAYEAVQEAQYAQLQQDAGPLVQGPPLQQVSVDGAMVPLVHKQWVEAKTVAIGTVQPPRHQADGTVAIHTSDLSYFSRVADCHDFTEKATIETMRRGTLTAGTVCGVVDGAVWEQGFLDVQCPAAVRILDWPHGVGYLANVAQALYGVDTNENHAWLAAQRQTLLHGDPQVVLHKLRGLQEELTLQAGEGPPPPALAVITESLEYLDKRAEQIRYAAFRALGYPIGSGAVESANKLVVEARLKGAGMHWAPAHVNPLLALRGMACSDRWEEGWPQLVTQWRAQARTQTRERRQRRQAARQAARDRAEAPTIPPEAAATLPPSCLASLPAAPRSPTPGTPPSLPAPQAHVAPAGSLHPPSPRRHPGPARPRRPAADHCWRRPFLTRRSSPNPGM